MYDYNKHVGKIVRRTSLADSQQTQSVCLATVISNCFQEKLRVNSYTIRLDNVAYANCKLIKANCELITAICKTVSENCELITAKIISQCAGMIVTHNFNFKFAHHGAKEFENSSPKLL